MKHGGQIAQLLEEHDSCIRGLDGLLMLLSEGGLTDEQGGYLEAVWEVVEKLKDVERRLKRALEAGSTLETLAHDPHIPSEVVTPLSVLVIDDDLVQQIFATRVLERRGHRVLTAANGMQGFEIARDGNFDVILMDCQMPEVDGFQLTKALRRWEMTRGGHVPIVAFTGHSVAGYRERCLEVGMDDYLKKPSTSKDLVGKVEALAQTRVR